MSKFILTVILSLASSAKAFQTPLQLSLNINSQLLENLKSDSSLSLFSISKIDINDKTIKVELLDSKGNCKAIPYEINRNEFGEIGVQLMPDAIAICDQ